MKCRNCNQLDLVFDRSLTIPYPGLASNLLLSHVLPTRLEEEQSKHSIEAIEARLSQLQEHAAYLETLIQELKVEQACCADEQFSLMESLRDQQSWGMRAASPYKKRYSTLSPRKRARNAAAVF
ncbi:hypothetical protein FIBSPDRAFT_124071 [Athelia psychrophila]|uniref:Uncharacterized protein n=1 Tax=Athelia psychrophila TaxID=1759441 RepID=A0A166CJM5_9AGAM|nr:hypothetical protein FIBSPDRAFT_124071 [Fibularhizoctonia sp. CBS 109695]